MGRKQNQKFHQIPILRLIHLIEEKCGDYGIQTKRIDEAYTSKTSSVSDNVIEVQADKGKKTHALNGRRVRRSLFYDTKIKKFFHADINAAANHVIIGFGRLHMDFLKTNIWKLANPVLLHAEHSYLDRRLPV